MFLGRFFLRSLYFTSDVGVYGADLVSGYCITIYVLYAHGVSVEQRLLEVGSVLCDEVGSGHYGLTYTPRVCYGLYRGCSRLTGSFTGYHNLLPHRQVSASIDTLDVSLHQLVSEIVV